MRNTSRVFKIRLTNISLIPNWSPIIVTFSPKTLPISPAIDAIVVIDQRITRHETAKGGEMSWSTWSAVALAALMAAPAVQARMNPAPMLTPGASLGPEQDMRSANGRYRVVMQSDCNLVVYDGARPMWSSRTDRRGSNCSAVFQPDGNLVIYSMGTTPIWSSQTLGRGGDAILLQDDGNLVMTAAGRTVWASTPSRPSLSALGLPPAPAPVAASRSTMPVGRQLTPNDEIRSPNGRYRLVMQTDCNLVLYDSARAIWASGTDRRGTSCQSLFQNDGNFVIYSMGGNAVWASNTVGRGGDRITLQDDGNLVMYAGSSAVWASNTGGRPTMPAPQAGFSGGSVLSAGMQLFAPSGTMTSRNGRYTLAMQGDCNLTITERGGRAMWASNTWGRGSSCRLDMQTDGNLVIYDGANRAVWSSGTNGRGTDRAMITDDGRLEVLAGPRAMFTTPLPAAVQAAIPTTPVLPPPSMGGGSTFGGASGPNLGYRIMPGQTLSARGGEMLRSRAGRYIAQMQQNCSLEVRDASGRVVWASPPAGYGANCIAGLERDGELTISNNGQHVWGSATRASDPSGAALQLSMEDDGRLVLSERSAVLWTSDRRIDPR
jgi:hypothetical protein